MTLRSVSQKFPLNDSSLDEKFDDEFEEESYLSIFFKSLLCFGALFVITALACTFFARGNPTSVFFDARTTHADYSSVRMREARELVHRASSVLQTKANNGSAVLCVVVTKSPRAGNHSYQNTIGSLLHGLADVERKQIHLTVASPSAADSSALDPWLENTVDSIIKPKAQLTELLRGHSQPNPQWERQSPSLKYAALLSAPHGEYVLVLHDDMIVMDGWFHRTIDAIGSANINHLLYEQAFPDEHTSSPRIKADDIDKSRCEFDSLVLPADNC